jgi:hypothetical protein
MPLSAFTVEFCKKNKRSLKEISIDKLKQELPLEQLLSVDRASYCLFEETPVRMSSRTPQSDPILWGGAMGINPAANGNSNPLNPAVFAIHLQNIELFPKARLLIYDHEFVITDYLGEGGRAVAKKWLQKKWSFGPISFSRSKSIPPITKQYEIGIDFSTDQGDGNVYHWTTRVLPKIKLVRLLPESIPLVFCQDLTTIQLESLKLFEVKNPIVVLNSKAVSHFNSYILIEGPWAGAHLPQLHFLQENFQAAIPAISQNHADVKKPRKIFIYREKKWARNLLNQSEIKQYLIDQGYETYSIDNMSIVETMAIFSSADEIVFEHGAAGVWLIFAKPSIKIIELLPERNHSTSNTIADFFYWQCQVLQQNHRYILGKVSQFEPEVQYSIDLNRLKYLLSS